MESSLQHLVEQLQQKKAQAEASLRNLQMESLFHTSTYYNYIIHKLNCLINAGSSIPDPDSYIREEIAKASVLYQKPLTTLVSQAFNLQAIFPFIGENHENADSQPVHNQEEMSGVVQNARQLAQQPIINTLPQNFNPAVASQNDSLHVSIKREADESMGNERESYGHDDDDDDEAYVKSEEDTQFPCIDISSDDEAGGQNGDDDSLDVSIKREVDSSSESECESDTEDEEVQVKQEPTEQEEDITARSQEQTENANNSDYNRENDSSNEVNLEEDPNGPIMTVVQYSSPSSSPSNAGQSINTPQFNSRSNHDNQIHLYDNESASEEEVDAGDYGDGNLEDEEQADDDVEDNDNVENDEDYLMNDEDSSDETTDGDDAVEDEQTAGPSTSTGRGSTRQSVPHRQSNGPIKKTEKFSVITKKLKCTVPGCKKVVKNRNALNGHLLSSHKLKKYRCLVRRCYGKVSTSFTTREQFTDHLDQFHGRRTRWTCHCSKKFNSYPGLCAHYWQYHQLGRFACSKDGCTFKPTRTRGKVLNHQYSHREAKYECPVDGCDRSFTQKGNLIVHLRMHRNDKCFRCTWPECTYSATSRSNVITHIRMVHFKLPRTKKQQAEEEIEDDRDPRDYLAMN